MSSPTSSSASSNRASHVCRPYVEYDCCHVAKRVAFFYQREKEASQSEVLTPEQRRQMLECVRSELEINPTSPSLASLKRAASVDQNVKPRFYHDRTWG